MNLEKENLQPDVKHRQAVYKVDISSETKTPAAAFLS